jgi:hypothetical protein
MADDVFGQPMAPAGSGGQSGSSSNYIDEYVPPQAAASAPAMSPTQPAAPSNSPQYTDVAPANPTSPSNASSTSSEPTQSLEDQNIFTLLGVQDGTDQEKESFLDELQQVIWEDFLETDAELLLTEQEMSELKQILDKVGVSDLEKQEEAVVFLEKLIPDLEEIMLEKALELKEAMVRERLTALFDVYGNDPSKKAGLDEARAAINQGYWRDAAEAMNSLK